MCCSYSRPEGGQELRHGPLRAGSAEKHRVAGDRSRDEVHRGRTEDPQDQTIAKCIYVCVYII